MESRVALPGEGENTRLTKPCHDLRIGRFTVKYRASWVLIFSAGCASAAPAIAPASPVATRGSIAASNIDPDVLAALRPMQKADEATGTLPFVMPCAADDVEGCRKGCDEKLTEDCVSLASIYLTGQLVQPDHARAIDLFKSA